jgi:signal transduction histidine kinase
VGREPPSLLTTLRDVLHPDDRKLVAARLRQAQRTRTGFTARCRVVRPDRTLRFVEITIEAQPDGAEGVGGWIGVVHDVTERQQLEQEVRHAQKLEAIGTLTIGLAHEYNNLLMGILGCIDLAQRYASPHDGGRLYLEQAREAAVEGGRLARRLLDFARPRDTDPCATDLDDVLQASATVLRTVLGDTVRLVVELDARRWRAGVACGEIEQVLMNFAVNARHAMPDGGTFTLATDEVVLSSADAEALQLPPGAYVRLRAEDTGTGMDPAIAGRIFEPFFTTKRPGRGTGLGLSTVYGIVGRCEGHIGVQTEPGRGTVFTIHFPRARATDEIARAHEPASAPRGSYGVLVVEGEPLVRLTVRSYLAPLGYRVFEACDLTEASLVLRRDGGAIDLVLSDVMLSGASGADVHAHVKRRHPTCPMIFMSAHPRDALEATGKLPPGSRALLKPFTAEQLVSELHNALHGGASSSQTELRFMGDERTA